MAQRLNFDSADFTEKLERLLGSKREVESDVHGIAASIIADVRERGDEALLALTAEYDGLVVRSVDELAISGNMLQEALDGLDYELLEALQLAAMRIRAFHEKQLPDEFFFTDDIGVKLGMRYTPVDAVGLYVPGGKAAYPSSVLMNAIPAMVAGVKRRVMVVPARGGEVNNLVLAAAALAGVNEAWLVGGAQAVAALAYGTDTIASVDKIVGPGNAFVAAAKRQVFGKVGIDSIAGPSEILVVADAQNDPAWIAADLLSQAEHDEAAQAILITDDLSLIHI